MSGPNGFSASFLYDGDGKRVQSTINGVTTTFVGNYYEVSGSEVTKYYYAGSTRVAMREGGELYFLLGDHLGSTSLTTNASGNVVSEMRYTAWGEVRHQSGSTQSEYTYTGQYSYADDLGLMFYNARWYDPALAHMVQADSLIPAAGNSQAWDRYAYVNNTPVRYNDPSGHCSGLPDGMIGGLLFYVSCAQDLADAVARIQSGESDPVKIYATAIGFDDWARKTGDRVAELNENADIVFSNAPAIKRLPAAVDVGWFAVATAANIVGTAQLARGLSAFSRVGPGSTDFAVTGSTHKGTYPVGDTLYRVFGGNKQIGHWLTPKNPGNQINAIRTLALPPANSATMISEVRVSNYMTAETSVVNSMFGQPGGGFQIYIPGYTNVIFRPPTQLPVGIMPFAPPDLPAWLERIFQE